jgi:hypothetical protein
LAEALAATSPMPLMLTGGITRRDTAERVLAGGVAVVGMATALATTPDLPRRWRTGTDVAAMLKPVTWSDKAIASMASMSQVRHQLRRLGGGKAPALRIGPARALIADQLIARRALSRYARWLATRGPGPAVVQAGGVR